MKVTQVSLCQTEASRYAGREALTPELLAATAARYSRNNEGLDAITAKIDPEHPDASVDSIFKMIDYGHQSIADMAPVAMFIDGISIWLAYKVWSLCPTAGGMESSTRYIKMSEDALVSPAEAGVAPALYGEWLDAMKDAFRHYGKMLEKWTEAAEANPQLINLPRELLGDDSPAAQKKLARMKRNFAFDRARYFLPVAALTNMALVMSARGWANLCKALASGISPEARRLAALIRSELELAAPRLSRHACATDDFETGLRDEMRFRSREAQWMLDDEWPGGAASDAAFLEAERPHGVSPYDVSAGLLHHPNRYGWTGSALRRTLVRFGWKAVSFAEIRDLNRHRTGTKWSDEIPLGFYCAQEQAGLLADGRDDLLKASQFGSRLSQKARNILREEDGSYPYWMLLGTQFNFEHATTADKFIYEAELRTGAGAHFRYAKHMRDALALWYDQFPNSRGLVLEGAAEPE